MVLYEEFFLNIKTFLHFTTDIFGQKLGTCSEKKILLFTLQRTFFSPISGYGRNKIFHAIKQSPSIYNGQFFLFVRDFSKNLKDPSYLTTDIFLRIGGVPPKNSFQFTTDIFSEKNRGLLENKNAPGLGKSGSIVICGYEISENSKHSRCPYTAAK
ncbi:MAG: hypothetical protein KH202_01685 [Clostridiales bacterium]|nr:hypothetical protein [Clostridiales bacterium]